MGDDLLKAVLEFIRDAEGAGFENKAGPLEHLLAYRALRALTDLAPLPALPDEAESRAKKNPRRGTPRAQ